jgi:nicotinamidase-related amidase
MKRIDDMDTFLRRAQDRLNSINESFDSLPVLKLSDFSPEDTVLVNVDINNGFCKYGSMYSPLVEEIIPYAVFLNALFRQYTRVYLLDKHTPDSEEFKTFTGIHCLRDDSESDLVPELAPFLDERSVICHKNSTNGFLCADYTRWYDKHKNITNFIVIGDVLDICVLQYCLIQKKYCDEQDISCRVILVVKGTETYHYEGNDHDAELMNLFALYNLRLNGVEIVEDIRED